MPAKAPVHPWETFEGQWIRIHLYFAGSFLVKMFLILYNSYSRWVEVYHISNVTSKATISSLRHSFPTHGLSHIIVTDNGTYFTSNKFSFCTMNGIKHIITALYYPSSNAPAERVVQTWKSSMKKICDNSNSDLITSISHFLISYRSTQHSFTSLSNAELLLSRKIKTRLSLLINKIKYENERRTKYFTTVTSFGLEILSKEKEND